jgi:hypothetical protein
MENRLIKLFLSIIIFSSLVNCNFNKNIKYDTRNAYNNIQQLQLKDTLLKDSLIIIWRQDSLGCEGKRSFQIAETLYSKYNFSCKNYQEVIDILGMPNEQLKGKNYYYTTLVYYYNAVCNSNTNDVIDSMKWSIKFQFNGRCKLFSITR